MKTKKQLQEELIAFMDAYEISGSLAAELLGYTNKSYIYGKRSGVNTIKPDEIEKLKRRYFDYLTKKLDSYKKNMEKQGFVLKI